MNITRRMRSDEEEHSDVIYHGEGVYNDGKIIDNAVEIRLHYFYGSKWDNHRVVGKYEAPAIDITVRFPEETETIRDAFVVDFIEFIQNKYNSDILPQLTATQV